MNRERNYISIFYEILGLYIIMKILSIITPIITLLFHYMLPQKHINMQLRFTLYIMRKSVYGHFTHILQKKKVDRSFCNNIVENHFYTKFGKKKKKNLKLKGIGDLKNNLYHKLLIA